MAFSDLLNVEETRPWMQAVSDNLAHTLLFITHPTDAGSAKTGPVFALNPTQVVAYELFTAARHTKNDANFGAGGSNDLFRAASVDPFGKVELFTTLSGSPGTAQSDSGMDYLVDSPGAAQTGLDVTDRSGATITTDNAYPSIWYIYLNLPSYADSPTTAVIDLHTHESPTEGDTLGRNALFTGTINFSGSIAADQLVLFELQPHSFFPMFHQTPGGVNYTGSYKGPTITGHNTSSDADHPRFGLTNEGTGGIYEVNARYLAAD